MGRNSASERAHRYRSGEAAKKLGQDDRDTLKKRSEREWTNEWMQSRVLSI